MTQKEKVLRHLKKGKTITQSKALELYAIGRLASRINDLRKDGVKIKSSKTSGKNRFGEIVNFSIYSL